MGFGTGLVVLGILLFALVVLWAVVFRNHDDAATPQSLTPDVVGSRRFYEDPPSSTPLASLDRVVLQVEHHVRRERVKAQRFVDDPRVETLRHGHEAVRGERD